MNMTEFQQKIKKIKPLKVSRIIGCKHQTARQWSCGRSAPEEWIQKLILKVLNDETKER